MADLTANRITPDVVNLDSVQGGYTIQYGVKASEEIYVGAFVEIDASGDLTSAGTSATSFQALGIALERKTGSATDSEIKCKVLVGAVIQHACTATKADIGAMVYASDDQTLTVTQAATSGLIGQIVGLGDATNIVLIQMLKPRVINQTVWAITNFVEDYDLDGEMALTAVSDGLQTLIRDLIAQGFATGSVAT